MDDALTAVVPFRLGSSRFPKKALCRFKGRSLLEHALEHAAALANQVVLTAPADDLERVLESMGALPDGVRPLASGARCRCATERLVELIDQLPGDRFLTLPVDEPAIEVAPLHAHLRSAELFGQAGAATFYCDFFAPEDYLSPLSAKIVVDVEGYLLYMSRAVIPVRKDGSVDPSALKKNVGAFVFKRDFLQELAARADQETMLERHEGLEQLRWLELGLKVRCHKVSHIGFGIDVPEQLERLEARVAKR